MMENKQIVFEKRVLSLGFIILDWVLCSYLVFRSNHLTDESNIPDLCKAIFGNSCDKVLSSPISWHLGYPLPSWGLAYFGLLGLLFSFRTLLFDRIVLALTIFGVGISVIQSAIIFKGGLSCPLCLFIHFINLLILATLLSGIPKSEFNSKQKLTTTSQSMVRSIFLLLFIFVIGGVSEVSMLKASVNKRGEANITEISKNFQNEKVHTIPINDASPHLGSLNAPIQLVVFSSFQCPACQAFAPILENIQKKFGSNIGITFKNFPLSSTCNPMMTEDMQPRACWAAFAAIAAHRQNNFWNYHDQLFQSDLEFDEKTLKSLAQKTGFNIEKWESDRQSDAVKENLSDDIKIANELGINATPTVFINGRRVNSFQENVLDFLIQNELNKG